jgi:hypothetical protein
MPSCTTSALSVDLGGWVRVIASWSQGTVAATLAQTVTLSVFIVGRPA